MRQRPRSAQPRRMHSFRRPQGSGRQAGFTLIEMMVALVAGLIAITSIYYVSSTASQHFHAQQRVATTQMSLRMAMEQLRGDIARAAFLGTPNSAVEQNCFPPTTQIMGIELLDDVDTAELDEAALNAVTADGLRLLGNYATGDSYLVNSLTAGGNQVTFQTNWQGFRRSFGVPYDSALFNEAFSVNRWVHIRTLQGNHFFTRITAVNGTANPPVVTFTPALPIGGACTGGLARGAVIAPLMEIEYRVVPMASLASLNNTTSPLAGVSGPVLVRREIDIVTGTPVANSERVVAEYIANFDVNFIVDTAPGVGAPVFALQQDAAAAATILATPERARTAVVELSLRTAAEDPNFPFVARGANDPLTRYELTTTGEGAARVRTARAEVFLPNFTPGL